MSTAMFFDFDEIEASNLRAEARAERRKYAHHWCTECLGHTGPGSPCHVPEEEEPTEESANGSE